MAGLDLKGLISKLNPVCQRALEGAAGLCLSRTNYNVEIEHWLVKLLEQPGNDVCLLLKHFEIDQARVLADLTRAIDRFKTGNARPPMLSPEVCELIKEGWLTASVAVASPALQRIAGEAGGGSVGRVSSHRSRCAATGGSACVPTVHGVGLHAWRCCC
jgi:type VI secretion system protein VasG